MERNSITSASRTAVRVQVHLTHHSGIQYNSRRRKPPVHSTPSPTSTSRQRHRWYPCSSWLDTQINQKVYSEHWKKTNSSDGVKDQSSIPSPPPPLCWGSSDLPSPCYRADCQAPFQSLQTQQSKRFKNLSWNQFSNTTSKKNSLTSWDFADVTSYERHEMTLCIPLTFLLLLLNGGFVCDDSGQVILILLFPHWLLQGQMIKMSTGIFSHEGLLSSLRTTSSLIVSILKPGPFCSFNYILGGCGYVMAKNKTMIDFAVLKRRSL